MSDKTWKAFERKIAKALGGERRGADYGDARGGKTDVIHPLWAIECKLYKRPTWGVLLGACRQAEAAAEAHQMPIAVMKKNGAPMGDTIVAMRLGEFRSWFVE